MVNGFQHNEEMFKRTLDAFMKPYYLTIGMYVALFAVGIGLFLVAALLAWSNPQSLTALAFAGSGRVLSSCSSSVSLFRHWKRIWNSSRGWGVAFKPPTGRG